MRFFTAKIGDSGRKRKTQSDFFAFFLGVRIWGLASLGPRKIAKTRFFAFFTYSLLWDNVRRFAKIASDFRPKFSVFFKTENFGFLPRGRGEPVQKSHTCLSSRKSYLVTFRSTNWWMPRWPKLAILEILIFCQNGKNRSKKGKWPTPRGAGGQPQIHFELGWCPSVRSEFLSFLT